MAKLQSQKPEAFSTDGFDKLRLEFDSKISTLRTDMGNNFKDLVYKGIPILITILVLIFGFLFTMLNRQGDLIAKLTDKNDSEKDRILVIETQLKPKSRPI